MAAQSEVLNALNKDLVRIRSRNPSFSIRSYARRLKVPHSTLSGIMSGKLPVTRRYAERLLNQLQLPPNQAQAIVSKLKNKTPSSKSYSDRGNDSEFTQVDMDQYHLISEWYYFAVLSLAETRDFQDNSEWIAKRLNIRKREARIALRRLERLGLLQKNSVGKLQWTGKQFRTTSNIANLSIRKSHFQNVELIRKSLEMDELDECDFTAMTMAIDPKKLPEAKKRITAFRRSLCAFLESSSKEEVYKVFIGLFPLTKISQRGNKK